MSSKQGQLGLQPCVTTHGDFLHSALTLVLSVSCTERPQLPGRAHSSVRAWPVGTQTQCCLQRADTPQV